MTVDEQNTIIAGLSIGLAVTSVLLGCAGLVLKANFSDCQDVDILYGCIKYSKNTSNDDSTDTHPV
jgi:hypothetical protein